MHRLVVICLAFAAASIGAPVRAATPPAQPESGPGGAVSDAGPLVKTAIGQASAATYVFYPAAAAAEPRPVVVLLHAWGAANPQFYGGWIEHLARKGNLVLFPRFQEVNRTRPVDATANAGRLVKDALQILADDPQARPDPQRVAYIGHLAGAAVALNLASDPAADGLPEPKFVFAVMPGGIASDPKARGIPLEDHSGIGPETLLIAMSGDRDYLPADRAGRRILKEAAAVPATRKLFMRTGSDNHGYPALSATLASPASPKAEYDAAAIKLPPDPPRDPKQKPPPWRWSADMALTGEQTVLTGQMATNATDALDYYGFWKTFDMAQAAALEGKDASVLRRDPRFTEMGSWNDGWPVRRLTADMPKAEGQESQQERGPRRKLN
jgi:hypothetical protein